MMNANQYPQSAYYQAGAPGYPGKVYPSPQSQSSNVPNGHWPPQMSAVGQTPPPPKKPQFPGQGVEHPQSPYHNPSAYQQSPNAYYARPMHTGGVRQQQQQYPPANMSPQAPRHFSIQHQNQRYPNSYSSSPYRTEAESKSSYQFPSGNSYSFESARNSMQYSQQSHPHPPQQQPPPAQPPPPPPQPQPQPPPQQNPMYPMTPPNMSYAQRQFIEPRNYGNNVSHSDQSRIRYQMNPASNFNQPRLSMNNGNLPPSASPMVSLKPNPPPQAYSSIRPQSPVTPQPVNEPNSAKKEPNDKHLRQALSSTMPSIVQKVENKIETIETTKPVFKRIKPLVNIGNVDHRKILMSLKSGLLAETTWAFDCLNILSNNGTFKLNSVPSLLTNLMDYYKCFLNSIFNDLFADTENDYQIKMIKAKQEECDIGREELEKLIRKGEKLYLLDSTNYTFKSRNGLPVQVKNEPRSNSCDLPIAHDFLNLEVSCDNTYYQDGNSLLTAHIVTHMDPIDEQIPFIRHSQHIGGNENSRDSQKKHKRKLDVILDRCEAEVLKPSTLCPRRESMETLIKRCHCISTIIRNLSFMPENSQLMAQNSALLHVIARLLAFNHNHYEVKSMAVIVEGQEKESYEKENMEREANEIFSDNPFDALHPIRMNTMVTLSNMSEFLDLANYSDKIILPLLDSLLHWAVCPASIAKDPHPPDSLSVQLLAFEIIVKLSMKMANIDLMLATPPFSRLEELYKILICSIGKEEEQVLRELSLVILANFSGADSLSARVILHLEYSISNLLTFIEQNEFNKRAQIYNRFNATTTPEPFTVTYMLKNAASVLRTIASECDKQDIHLLRKHEERIVELTMSGMLEPEVSQILADLIYILSNKSK